MSDLLDRTGWRWGFAAVVIVQAALLRFAWLERYPELVNEDELSNVYDGWSIAETGADRSGRRYPILCRGWGPGDNRPSMFAWFCAIPSRFVGFSVGWGRAVSALFGIATVILVGVWGGRVFGYWGGLAAMLVLSVSPWHVLFSRLAHEGCALPGFFGVVIILTVRTAVLSLNSAMSWHCVCRSWLIAGLVIGVSTNAYGATRLTGLLFALGAAGMLMVWPGGGVGVRRRLQLLMLLGVAALAGAGPQVWAMWDDPTAFFGRAAMTRAHFFGWMDAMESVARGVWAHIEPRYLFYSFGEFDKLAAGRLSFVTLPFFYLGLAVLLLGGRGVSRLDRVLLVGGALICMSPAIATRTVPSAIRASGCAVLFPMISVVGMVRVVSWVRGVDVDPAQPTRRIASAAAVGGLCGLTVLVGGWSYVWRYVHSADMPRIMQQVELVTIGRWVGRNGAGYDRVYIEPVGRQIDLYVAAFSGMRPREYQRADRHVWGSMNEYCTQLGRYYFAGRAEALRQWQLSPKTERWLVVDASLADPVVLEGPS